MTRTQQHSALLLALVWQALSAGPALAELRCTSQSSSAEQLICADRTLQRLDTRLNEVYANTAQYVPDRQVLVKEQRAWLKGARDTCADSICMYKVMDERMRQLAELQLRHQPVNVDEISDREALESCRDIARFSEQGRLGGMALYGQRIMQATSPEDVDKNPWAVSGELLDGLQRKFNSSRPPEDIFLLRTNREMPVKFATIDHGGSCSALQIHNVPLAMSGKDEGIDGVHDPDDKIRSARSGMVDYPIHHNGRNFIVTADVVDANAVTLISVVRPNGRIRPICLTSVKRGWREPAMARDKALCMAVAQKKIMPLAWKDITDTLPFKRDTQTYQKEFDRRYERYADRVSVLRVDLDGDKSTERIARFEYASGGGCGSTQTWLRVMADDNGRVLKHAMSPALDKIANGSLDVYDFGGRRYIETIGENVRDTLVSIRDGRVEPVCEFRAKWELEITPLSKK